MKCMSIFPFRQKNIGKDLGSKLFQEFMRAKPKNMSWYEADAVIHSPTRVVFVVYEMYDSVYGGRGSRIANIDATVPITSTKTAIVRAATADAQEKRTAELAQLEATIVAEYTDKLLTEIYCGGYHST